MCKSEDNLGVAELVGSMESILFLDNTEKILLGILL